MKPAARMLLLLGAWLVLAVAGCLWPEPWLALWEGAGLLLAAVALADALLGRRQPSPRLERTLPGVLPVGVWTPVQVRLLNPAGAARRVRWFDGVPPALACRRQPQEARLGPGAWAALSYGVRPRRRGPCRFAPASLLSSSPLGLWWLASRGGPAQPVQVYPNFAPVRRFAELAAGHRLDQLGIHQQRRRGEGSEFHQLRDYRQGDSLRQLDWKATARMRRLIAKDYREEQDQQVICLLDCGRRLRAQDGPAAHFDHALTALLLLAYVAQRQGDAVGLLTFAGPERWVAPRRRASLDPLLAAVRDLQPSLRASDFLAAARALLERTRKRSLVVILTDLRDEDEETLGPALHLLRRRHRVILASLREPELEQALRAPVTDFEGALRAGAIDAYLAERRRAFARLDPGGAVALDVLPDQLAVALVNRYLAMKRAGAP